MALKPDKGCIQQVMGWSFEQFAYAAAFAQRHTPGEQLPPPNIEGLANVQIMWVERRAAYVAPECGVNLFPRYCYCWLWTCAAFYAAAVECNMAEPIAEPSPYPPGDPA